MKIIVPPPGVSSLIHRAGCALNAWTEARSVPAEISATRAGGARIGVFGGSFDPVHVGHLIVAEVLRHALALERVLFLPAGRPPHKPTQELAADADRLAMLNLALAGAPYFEISTVDLDRPGPSYTAESLRVLRGQLPPDCELYFLIGQDSLRDFPTWHAPAAIAGLARLGVALRPGVVATVEAVNRAVPDTSGRVELVPVPLIDVASRTIRANIRAGGPYRFQVPPAVADYIAERGLYGATFEAPPTSVTR
jgi:nicotinate-nucleotide adenylyltransferase